MKYYLAAIHMIQSANSQAITIFLLKTAMRLHARLRNDRIFSLRSAYNLSVFFNAFYYTYQLQPGNAIAILQTLVDTNGIMLGFSAVAFTTLLPTGAIKKHWGNILGAIAYTITLYLFSIFICFLTMVRLPNITEDILSRSFAVSLILMTLATTMKYLGPRLRLLFLR